MPLFKIQNKSVKKLIANDLDLEKKLQSLFEGNLEEILNITFLAHEFSTSFGGRIDTLGIDKDGSPCIIEYKKNRSESVINQGLSYLRWLLDHKADFEKIGKNLKIETDVDWNSPRVICVAESYSPFDLDTAEILYSSAHLKVELWKYTIYENNILHLEQEKGRKIKIVTGGIDRGVRNEGKIEVLQKAFTLDEHISRGNEEIKSLFLKLREEITSWDEGIVEEPKAQYIAYKTSTNFVDVVILRNSLKMTLNIKSGHLDDPNNIARDLEKPRHVGHWGNGDYEIKLEKETELAKILGLIKQSYDFNR